MKIKLIKSTIGKTRRIRETIRVLGFKRMQQTIEVKDNPEVKGMVAKVRHMISIVK